MQTSAGQSQGSSPLGQVFGTIGLDGRTLLLTGSRETTGFPAKDAPATGSGNPSRECPKMTGLSG